MADELMSELYDAKCRIGWLFTVHDMVKFRR